MVAMAQSAANWRNTHTHVDARFLSHTYMNTVTTTLWEAPAQLLDNFKSICVCVCVKVPENTVITGVKSAAEEKEPSLITTPAPTPPTDAYIHIYTQNSYTDESPPSKLWGTKLVLHLLMMTQQQSKLWYMDSVSWLCPAQ